MTTGRDGGTWTRVEALFDEVLEMSEGDRQAWLARAAQGDAIEREVHGLVTAAAQDGILDREIPAALISDAEVDALGRRLEAALAGQYRIDRALGEGGTATVFLAHEAKHNRAVVLKVLKEEAALWIGADRFRTEIQILARLSHPHIVPLIDSGEVAGLLYYVMPYLGGETLRERMHAGQLTAGAALGILTDVSRALAHAHASGIVHRDIKPANVLCLAGHTFLMDFGIARAEGPAHGAGHTQEGVVIGTPEWMAPEQRAGRAVDARTDVYAFGLLARAVLAGSATDDRLALVQQVANDCVQEDPARRPASGEILRQRLVAIAQRGPVRRPRTVWVSVAAAALAVLGWVIWKRESRIDPSSIPAPVVVSPLRNETGDTTLDVWGRMAGDWLTQGLLESGDVAVVPWPVALQSARQTSDSADAIGALLRETGAKAVLTGTYYLTGGVVQFQAQLSDARGRTIAALPPVEAPRDSINHAIQDLRDRLRGMLAVRSDERVQAFAMAERPPLFTAYQDFERGVAAYNTQRYDDAIAALRSAWSRDTLFDAALVYLARSLWNTGERGLVDSLVRQVRKRPVSMSPYLDAQFRYLEATLAGDGTQALAAIREAAQRAPGGRDWYNVANSALSLGQPAEAERILRTLDPERGAMKGWAPYWYVLTHAMHLQGKYAEEWPVSIELRKRYPQSRAAWVHLVRTAAAMGRTGVIDSLLQVAAPEPPDTYWSQGAMMVNAAEELEAHGFAAQAPKYYAQAEQWFANHLARNPSHEGHRFWMGSALYDQGKWDQAQPYFLSLLETNPGELRSRGAIALIHAHRGDFARADSVLGDPPQYERAEHTIFRARLAGVKKDTAAAAALWTQAVAHGQGPLIWQHHRARGELGVLLGHPVARQLGLVLR